MKTASNVFTVIGMIANIALAFLYTTSSFAAVFWILAGLCMTFGICGLASSTKHTFIGIMMLLFVNIFSGIFYLCWDE